MKLRLRLVLIGLAIALGVAIAVVCIFSVGTYRIPGRGMMPTLSVGDVVLADKLAYSVRLPVSNTRLFGTASPRRGDIVIFQSPLDPRHDYVKRVIGLPGDTVVLRGEQLSINGNAVPQAPVGPYRGRGAVAAPTPLAPGMPPLSEHEETLGAARYQILQASQTRPYGCTGTGGMSLPDGCKWRVPADDYFVLGDNRDDSYDSRFWGFVPARDLVGKVFLVASGSRGWHRIGTVLH